MAGVVADDTPPNTRARFWLRVCAPPALPRPRSGTWCHQASRDHLLAGVGHRGRRHGAWQLAAGRTRERELFFVFFFDPPKTNSPHTHHHTPSQVYDKDQASLRDKNEADLKKELKKLQKCRDAIKGWLSGSDVKDKSDLARARADIERRMEKFKACERESKTKTFSREGLALQAARAQDPETAAREAARDWINETVSKFNEELDSMDAELETLAAGRGRRGRAPPRATALETQSERHRAHIARLEQLLRLLDNEAVDADEVDGVRDLVDDYASRCGDAPGGPGEFADPDDLYEGLVDRLDAVEASLPAVPSTAALKTHGEGGKKKEDGDSGAPTSKKEDDRAAAAAAAVKQQLAAAGVLQGAAAASVASKDDRPSADGAKKEAPSPAAPNPSAPPPSPPARPAGWAAPPGGAAAARSGAGSGDGGAAATTGDGASPASSAATTPRSPAAPPPPPPPRGDDATTPPAATGPPPAPPAVLHALLAACAPRSIPTPADSAWSPVPPRCRSLPRGPPASYPATRPPALDSPALYERLDTQALFFAFYYLPGSLAQNLAARELKRQSWRYHKQHGAWFQRHEEPTAATGTYERGTYVYFDYSVVHDDARAGWCYRLKQDFTFQYDALEDELVP